MSNHVSANNIFSKFWYDITDWFTSTRYLNEDSFITRLRYFQITSFSFLFITSFAYFLGNLGASYIVTATTCMLLIFIRYLLDNKKEKEAYLLMLVCINTSIILLTAVEGIHSGVFLYFFPSIISFVFLADLTSKKNVILTYTIGISSFLLAILFAPDNGNLNEVLTGMNRKNFSINLILAFLLVVSMSFTLAKENTRKQAVLRNKEKFLDTIFNSSLHTEIIMEVKNGLISSCNRHASSLFGLSDDQSLNNRPVRELFVEVTQDPQGELTKNMFAPLHNWEGELTCKRYDGSVFPGSISIVSFTYMDKEFKKITIVDIAEKNAILNELQEAKMKAEESVFIKSQFLSHMSHELRTPLNGIIGSTNLLLQDDFLPGQKDQLEVLRFSSEHMLNLINDILDLSKLEANKIQLDVAVVDIHHLIHKIISPFVPQFEEKEVLLEVAVDPSLNNDLLADATRLNQVLTNLLSNALKFTAKGSVKVELKGLSVNNESTTIEISVTDTGIGIPLDKREQIFGQFNQADIKTTRKYGGTGLGLTISRKLVKLMGGELKVESKYQKGSRFYFDITLPVHSGLKKTFVSDDKQLNEIKQLKGLKVLIAEDNPINMMIATKFLDKWGIVYEKAKNGLEAISLFEKGSFDLVLMDLEMPEMDGYGALNIIREKQPAIPAIAFTAAVFENMKENLLDKGFNDYIQKPFRPIDLQAKLVAFSEMVGKRA